MADNQKNDSFNPDDLPEKGVFKRKELDQHKPPASRGKPIESPGDNESATVPGKDADKTSKEEGLNEERSTGIAGAFEGFESRRDI